MHQLIVHAKGISLHASNPNLNLLKTAGFSFFNPSAFYWVWSTTQNWSRRTTDTFFLPNSSSPPPKRRLLAAESAALGFGRLHPRTLRCDPGYDTTTAFRLPLSVWPAY